MTSFEDLTPRRQSLEALVMSYCDEVDEKLEAIRTINSDIIEPNSEIHHDIVAIGRFADFCSQYFAETTESRAEVSATIYRSICFAEQVTDMVMPQSYSSSQTDYINQAMRQYNSIDDLMTDTRDYQNQRQEIDSLISYYSPYIDPTGQHRHVVETFSSMFFMLTERSNSEQLIMSQIDYITPEDIINKTPQT